MTRTQATTKQAARAISGVVIAGRGFRKSDHAPLYGATSASEPGKLNLVIWEADRNEWVCGCAGFSFRGHCRHVKALAVYLAAARVVADVVEIASDPEARFSLTEKGAVALAEWRQQKEARETSSRRGPAAFSILK